MIEIDGVKIDQNTATVKRALGNQFGVFIGTACVDFYSDLESAQRCAEAIRLLPTGAKLAYGANQRLQRGGVPLVSPPKPKKEKVSR